MLYFYVDFYQTDTQLLYHLVYALHEQQNLFYLYVDHQLQIAPGVVQLPLTRVEDSDPVIRLGDLVPPREELGDAEKLLDRLIGPVLLGQDVGQVEMGIRRQAMVRQRHTEFVLEIREHAQASYDHARIDLMAKLNR